MKRSMVRMSGNVHSTPPDIRVVPPIVGAFSRIVTAAPASAAATAAHNPAIPLPATTTRRCDISDARLSRGWANDCWIGTGHSSAPGLEQGGWLDGNARSHDLHAGQGPQPQPQPFPR